MTPTGTLLIDQDGLLIHAIYEEASHGKWFAHMIVDRSEQAETLIGHNLQDAKAQAESWAIARYRRPRAA